MMSISQQSSQSIDSKEYLALLHPDLLKDASRTEFNILFVIDRLSEMGGAELALSRLVRELPLRGIRPLLVTFSPDLCGPLMKQFICEVQVFPLRRTYDYEALRVAQQIRSLIVSRRIDVVHTFFETSDLFGGLIARSVPGVALVTSRRDMGILRGLKHRIAYPLLSRLAHRVVTVSERVREWCIEADHLRPDRVVTVYNGINVTSGLSTSEVNPAREAMRNCLGVSDSQVVITAIGHIRHIKGYDVMIEAAALVLRANPDAVFVIAGAEHEMGRKQELQDLAKTRKIESSVHFLGEVQQIPSLLGATDIFLLPSRSEGFSNALIEAMGSGLPCVATEVGGNAEAVADGVSGLIVPSEAPEALAAALRTLVRSAVRRRSMGEEGRRITQSRFTHTAMVANMIALYRDVLREVGHPIADTAPNAPAH